MEPDTWYLGLIFSKNLLESFLSILAYLTLGHFYDDSGSKPALQNAEEEPDTTWDTKLLFPGLRWPQDTPKHTSPSF